MRHVIAILAAGLMLALAGVHEPVAGPRGSQSAGTTGSTGSTGRSARPLEGARDRLAERRKFRRKLRRAGRPLVIFDRDHDLDRDDREIVVVPVPRPPEPDPPEAEPAPPPDPSSPRHVALARGVGPADPGWEIGEPLPADRPQVTLDWRTYGLPEPALGHVYARVGRAILLIATDGRVVVERVAPPAREGD